MEGAKILFFYISFLISSFVVSEPTWKQSIFKELHKINHNSEVMQLFFTQAGKSNQISVETLTEALKKADKRIQTLEESEKEKIQTINTLTSENEHLKRQIPDEDVLSRYNI